MKKLMLSAALLLSMLSVVNCGGDPEPVIQPDGTGEDWTLQSGPNWFEERSGEKDGHIYAYGMSSGTRNPSLARRSAQAQARQEMAAFLNTKIKSMLDDYASSVAEGGPAIESRLTEALTREIVDQEISGFKLGKSQIAGKHYYIRGYITAEGLKETLVQSEKVKELVEKTVRGRKDKFADLMEKETKSIVAEAANRQGPALK